MSLAGIRARPALVVAGVALVFASACGERRTAGRSGRTANPPAGGADSGVARDAGGGGGGGGTDAAVPDLGFADAGLPDSGVMPPRPDAGFPDAGFPDSGPPADAGVMPVRVSIFDLQDQSRPGFPGVEVPVRLTGVVVTALLPALGMNDKGFWVQEPSGGPFSGVHVFVPPAMPMPAVSVGDELSLTGRRTEYFDLTEVVLDQIESVRPTVPLQPTPVLPSALASGSASAEQWEGVLVQVDSLSVTDANPDLPMDFNEFVVNGGLRVDDQIFRIEPRPFVGETFTRIVGIHQYRFENYKLLPRSSLDVIRP